jgi:hypothetical protein
LMIEESNSSPVTLQTLFSFPTASVELTSCARLGRIEFGIGGAAGCGGRRRDGRGTGGVRGGQGGCRDAIPPSLHTQSARGLRLRGLPQGGEALSTTLCSMFSALLLSVSLALCSLALFSLLSALYPYFES